MEPTKDSEDVLVDLLDVLLERGVVIEADVIIAVADIPLVGLKLRAALAGLTTMREYGIFEDWDVEQRRRRREHAPQPGGSMTGRPNPRRARDPETKRTVASGRPYGERATGDRPGDDADRRSKGGRGDRPSAGRRPDERTEGDDDAVGERPDGDADPSDPLGGAEGFADDRTRSDDAEERADSDAEDRSDDADDRSEG